MPFKLCCYISITACASSRCVTPLGCTRLRLEHLPLPTAYLPPELLYFGVDIVVAHPDVVITYEVYKDLELADFGIVLINHLINVTVIFSYCLTAINLVFIAYLSRLNTDLVSITLDLIL